jgi:hypothetical protein
LKRLGPNPNIKAAAGRMRNIIIARMKQTKDKTNNFLALFFRDFWIMASINVIKAASIKMIGV